MWEIIYSVDNNYRDRDNYSACRTGEPEYIGGDTLNEAVKNLLERLQQDGMLKHIIETQAKNLTSYDDCYSLSIVSANKVAESADLDIDKHPEFLDLVNQRKAEIKTEAKKKDRRIRKAEREKELKLLSKLKTKYEK